MSEPQQRQASLIALLGDLVSCPSRAGEDNCESLLQTVADWLSNHGITAQCLRDDQGRALALCGELQGARPGPVYILNAPADTAPFGDPGAWTHPPDRPTIADGYLYGRGSADSKAGVAVFCHVLAALAPQAAQWSGTVGFVFDAEEHSGTFAGIRAYLERYSELSISGVMIGYPGNERVVTGARGFLRACLELHGVAAHSGSSSGGGINAIDRARVLTNAMAAAPLPGADEQFPLPPKVTFTGIRGGGSFTLIPDRCELDIDIRLTPRFDQTAAQHWLTDLIRTLDQDSRVRPTSITWHPGWPAYQLPAGHPMVTALSAAAAEAFGHTLPSAVVGPSSIANLLATQGIPATAGLGVSYRNIHAADECVDLASLEPTYQTYLGALLRLLK